MPSSTRIKRVMYSAAALAGLAVMTFAPLGARAQTTNNGSVLGQVTDAQGKAIVGAVVTLTDTADNSTQATITNDQGRYAFPTLQPGTYAVDVKKDGFKEAQIKGEDVALGKPLTVNVPMQVGASTQTVEVTATGAELQTMSATVGTEVNSDAIMKLPAMGRDANTLTILQPNTSPAGNVAGSEMDQNSYSLDGGSNSDDMDGAHSIYTPSSGSTGTGAGGNPSGVMPTPSESIQTFTVGVNNQSADVNSAAGSSVSMATRRGTDTLHGSAYEYYLGSALAANTWSNKFNGTPRAVSHQNRFGASLGGEILPNFLGGKTYLFGDYEGRRYPNYATYTQQTPTASLKAGVIALQNTSGANSGQWNYYNLNPTSVTVATRVNGAYTNATIAPATCSGKDINNNAVDGVPCDPQQLGLNPVTKAIWNTYMPAGNLPVANPGGDGGFNTANFTGSLNESLKSNFFVERLDHDFGAKNHFTSTYHFYSFNPNFPAQVDIGGALPGDSLGQPATPSQRPQLPSMWTAQLTSSLSSNTTNTFTYSYLRNFWQWTGVDTAPQNIGALGTLGGTMEISGETANGLQPYNVNTQSTRTRFWDGIGNTLSDDVSSIHGNHVFSFGGKYTHQWDEHQRNDNGASVDITTAYLTSTSNSGAPINNSFVPDGFSGNISSTSWADLYSGVLGIVTQSQTMYTRAGQNLSLQAQGTPLEDEDNIPMYNAYFSDAWHLTPSLTVTYGTGYTVEMPPQEVAGRQVEAVDAAGLQITSPSYVAATEAAALGGQSYNPEIGFATVNNIGSGLKYPYNTFYGGLSPRISLAWNPNVSDGLLGSLLGGNKTVVRGGWSRIYGRLNGVDQVLVPLLGTGLAQPIQCQDPVAGNLCLGSNGATPFNAFRIGPTSAGDNGLTVGLGAPPTQNLPQPYFGGEIQNGVANPNAGSNDSLDPDFKPDRSDEFDLTIQRQFSPTFSTELGYTGRIMRNEYQAINLDSVPYMLTAAGQQFKDAYANLALAMEANVPLSGIVPQPFFEQALGGPSSNFCKKFSSCTAAVAATYGPGSKSAVAPYGGNDTLDPVTGFNVFTMFSNLQQSSSWTLGRVTPDAPTTCATGTPGCPASGIIANSGQLTALFMETSNGWGNYNGAFWTVSMRNWHHLTAISNFTWSRTMGTGDTDQATSSYTVNDPFNLHAMYGPQTFDTPLNYNLYFIYEPGGKTQHTLLEHLTNGWSIAPVVYWNTAWTSVALAKNCDSFGESNCATDTAEERAVKTTGYTGSNVVSYGTSNGTIGSSGNAVNGGNGLNFFGNSAAAIYSEFRPIILGYDTTGLSASDIPAPHFWDMDLSVTKDLALTERFSTEFNAQATDIWNHANLNNPSLNLGRPTSFGTTSKSGARAVEIGLAVRW